MAKLRDGSCRGYCKITLKPRSDLAKCHGWKCSNKEALLRIRHEVMGNVINIEEYIAEKGNLTQKDQELVKSRVCVLNIPPRNFTDKDLNDIFTIYFGKVRGAYVRDNKKMKGKRSKSKREKKK